MIVKASIAILLGLPATISLLGIVVVLLPDRTLHLPTLLLVFPVYVVIASGSYLIKRPAYAALLLVCVTLFGLTTIQALKTFGLGPV